MSVDSDLLPTAYFGGFVQTNMRNKKVFKSFLAIISFIAVFSVAAIAQTYSGQAFSGGVTVDVFGQPVVTSNVLDTGDLPANGGNITQSSVGLYVLPGGVLSLGDRTSSTSGSGSSSQSSASVNSVNVGALGFSNLVTAGVISSSTSATCPGEVLLSNSSVVNLVAFGSPVTVLGTPNQIVTIDLGSSRVLKLVINERIVHPRSITRNALHITVTDPLGLNTTVDVIIASSRSGINCLVAPLDDLYSGRGTAIRVKQNSLLIPFLSTVVADTGWLPTPGTAPGPPITSTTVGAGVNPILTSGTVFSSTEGGDPAGTSASHSEVEDLGIGIANPLIGPAILTLSADVLQSDTQCSCTLGVPTCTGDSDVLGLAVTVLGIPITIPLDFPPNTTLVNQNVLGLANLRIVVNEQFAASPAEINVNALHVELGVLSALLVDTDIVVAHAHSDIVCGLAPSAAPVSLSGRVYDAYGRGLARTIVTITDGEFYQSATTNNFGYYAFKEIPGGGTYVVGAFSKQYNFSQQVVTLNDSLAGFDLFPDSGRFEIKKQTSGSPTGLEMLPTEGQVEVKRTAPARMTVVNLPSDSDKDEDKIENEKPER